MVEDPSPERTYARWETYVIHNSEKTIDVFEKDLSNRLVVVVIIFVF